MRWTLKPVPDIKQVSTLAESLGVEPLIAQLLLHRGISDFEGARSFFRPSWDDLHDPYEMADMDIAVKRIRKAVESGEHILVYGDYDVDGTTAVALLSSYLQDFTPLVATYIPDRYTEGYGVSFQGIDFASDNGVSLIIALDCGVKAHRQVSYAAEKGIDFIICDHHRPGDTLPAAVAVLDPKRDDCSYPYKELCGCGIGFKLIQALALAFVQPQEELYPYLDLVATAIGADIVPITGENRVLTYFGLQQINQSPRPGFRALLEKAARQVVNCTDLVFILAPRINAAGRMHHGQHAVALLSSKDPEEASKLAAGIEDFNTERRGLDQEITKEALVQIQENGEEGRFTSVVYKEDWHKGVIGIVASRLTETYYRPTLVFTKSGAKLAASARSVRGFDVYNALEACTDCIEQFGGHKYAAGLTLLESQYLTFKARFEEVVAQTIDPSLLTPEILVDSRLSLDQLSPRLWRILQQFEPFGPGNMCPVFLAEKVTDTGYAKVVGKGGEHLKLSVTRNGSPSIGAIGFNLGHLLDKVRDGKPFDMVFTIDKNEWNGHASLQLKVKDIR